MSYLMGPLKRSLRILITVPLGIYHSIVFVAIDSQKLN